MSRRKTDRPAGRGPGLAVSCAVFSLSCVMWGVGAWLGMTFNINFQEILYTMTSPLVGTDGGVVLKCLRACLPHLCLAALFVLAARAIALLQRRFRAVLTFRLRGRERRADLFRLARRAMGIVSLLALCWGLRSLYVNLRVGEYLALRRDPTTIYEDRYVDPAQASVTAPEQKKNMICIYLESMETAYASQDAGGRQPDCNYIPDLTALAQENLSFSNSERLGGFRAVSGTTWTMGALFAATSGLPFSFPVGENAMNRHGSFASGCTTLGDILADSGYRNMFLCGSDATFGGRRLYYQQHGDYHICDLFTAREEGYIPQDYKVWWGYEDQILYEIARDKLTELAQSEQPFSFTMLTVDTHHVDGYLCPLCREDYPTVTGNVVSCADRQIGDFIRWCQEQDFYENSVIVITGDHPRMDTNLVEGLDYYDRTVYNCFLNCDLPARTANREFTAVDLFPTVLTALGFTFQGDQLGFGVDLFSDSDTLSEVMGFQALDREFGKYSPFVEEFLS